MLNFEAAQAPTPSMISARVADVVASPERSIAAFDAVIASVGELTGEDTPSGAAAALAGQRYFLQSLEAAKSNLVAAYGADDDVLRAAMAELARVQVIQVTSVFRTLTHQGLVFDDDLNQRLFTLAGLAVDVATAARMGL